MARSASEGGGGFRALSVVPRYTPRWTVRHTTHLHAWHNAPRLAPEQKQSLMRAITRQWFLESELRVKAATTCCARPAKREAATHAGGLGVERDGGDGCRGDGRLEHAQRLVRGTRDDGTERVVQTRHLV